MHLSPLRDDPLTLYEASVLSTEFDLDFIERAYRAARGRGFTRLREDFCGTAALACAWALRKPTNTAIGVDHDLKVLAWARRHHLASMREAARRVTLARHDVRRVTRPPVDVVVALNFSYWVFHERDGLRRYFSAARRSLRAGGMLVVNAFGGTEAIDVIEERRRIPASQGPDGLRIPGFTYVWEHESFNPVDHRIRCAIHFRLANGRWMRRAFHYDWRLWTLPEIREVMREAGFRDTHVYAQGWDEGRMEGDGRFRRTESFANQAGWLTYVVGLK